MCGIALLYGDSAEQHIQETLANLYHRGPDDQHYCIEGKLALGFVRLAINGNITNGRQPYKNNDMIGAINGEIYNASTLIKQHSLALDSVCDTHVVVPLLAKLNSKVLAKLDGFYSGVIFQKSTQTLYLLRDHIGKKPLFYGRANGNLFVVSELKALQNIEWFEQVPLGISQLDFETGKLTQIAQHKQIPKVPSCLFTELEQAVIKRLPTQKFGIFLSGGLDSSIITVLANLYRKDISYFVLGDSNSSDITMSSLLVKYLDLSNVHYIPLPNENELPTLIEKIVNATESYNPSTISNGLATYLLAQAAHQEELKVVLTGEGADELFAGYHQQLSEQEWQATRTELITNMHFTELRRLDTCCMAHGIEARCPFLDSKVKTIADNLQHTDFYLHSANKVALRKSFEHLLPKEIAWRVKTSFDVGSGIRNLVVNYLRRNGNTETAELKKIWLQTFTYDEKDPYFFSYPTFDAVIAKRGSSHRCL